VRQTDASGLLKNVGVRKFCSLKAALLQGWTSALHDGPSKRPGQRDLHYVLDLWFEHKVHKVNHGQSYLIRYADDFVCGFAYRHEAERFVSQLQERLKQFGLEVTPDKTRMMRFGRGGGPHNGRFDFLGFEFYWRLSRRGRPLVQRRTARKRLCKSVATFTE
jgi:RNA-directed DNA polymerase